MDRARAALAAGLSVVVDWIGRAGGGQRFQLGSLERGDQFQPTRERDGVAGRVGQEAFYRLSATLDLELEAKALCFHIR
jgi:hypothetical protein